jgi:hypothetical protein
MIRDVGGVAALAAWYAQRDSGPGPLSIPPFKLKRHAGAVSCSWLRSGRRRALVQCTQPTSGRREGLRADQPVPGSGAGPRHGRRLLARPTTPPRPGARASATWGDPSVVLACAVPSQAASGTSDRLVGCAPDFGAVIPSDGHLSGAVQLLQRVFSPRNQEHRETALSSFGERSGGFDVLALGTRLRWGALSWEPPSTRWINGYSGRSGGETANSRRSTTDCGGNFNLGLIWDQCRASTSAPRQTAFTGGVDRPQPDHLFGIPAPP